MERYEYPFAAIVGQEKLKTALLLNLVDPRLGGVLIQGEKGRPSLQRYAVWRR